MSKIFISYRRDDSAVIAGRIYDHLIPPLGPFEPEDVFKDVDSIPLGVNFKKYISEKVAECGVCLVIIGPKWVDIADEHGNQRLDNPSDPVRIEVESALQRDIPVIPLLVMGAQMPVENALPETLRGLVYQNGRPVQNDPYFKYDIGHVVKSLQQWLSNSATLPISPDPIAQSGERARKRLAALEKARQCRADYENIVQLAASPVTLDRAIDLWAEYIIQCGPEYDPQGFGGDSRFNTETFISPLAVGPLGPEVENLPTLPTPHAGDRGIDLYGTAYVVYVPTGNFLMGSSDGYSAEEPIHPITIANPFWIDLTPVTNEAFDQFINNGGYKAKDLWTEAGWRWVQDNRITGPHNNTNFTDPKQPRVGVSWFEAYAYAKWRGGRLPSEAEWEWAARGPENRVYPWGNTFDAKRGIYMENSGKKSAVVGDEIRTVGASWVGALDMSGNVWEWCSSCLKPYPYLESDGRENLDDADSPRIARGGSCLGNAGDARSACRGNDRPNARSANFGFRVVTPT